MNDTQDPRATFTEMVEHLGDLISHARHEGYERMADLLYADLETLLTERRFYTNVADATAPPRHPIPW